MNIYFLANVSAGTLAIFYVVIFIIAAFLAVCWIASHAPDKKRPQRQRQGAAIPRR